MFYVIVRRWWPWLRPECGVSKVEHAEKRLFEGIRRFGVLNAVVESF
jgi:hypothetical protein